MMAQSSQVTIKKVSVITIFGLFSLIFVGIIFAVTGDFQVSATNQDDISYISWLTIAYLAGLSMIALPCTLPLVFIIVPITMNQDKRKGLSMAVLFGLGLVTTITAYGVGVAQFGKTASLDQISFTMFFIAGIAAFVFGMSQLELLKLKMPSYSGTPKFIQKQGDYAKSFSMGLLLGNAGVGCPNPLFYWLLIHIASLGSLELGASLGVVHGVGRAVPLILMSVLAILGINATSSLKTKRETIEKLTGWMLIIIGAFLIIQGIPGGHEWYENTFIHLTWNNMVSNTPIPAEFHIGAHQHETFLNFEITENMAMALFISLLAFPALWYLKKFKIHSTKNHP
ncbi:MAG: cytochrome C biogenesis protein [Nitrosopumilaceae archaeon]|nr:cytochrome C biogenesis protein [Nitrosopumilaceae archaeon]NIU01765.1 cytochrome C biogenesis protein [Nitrosopumilaceae archaeon]NIU88165.1 cytochrome C biogenesis protein [Nitrosopumilaceae archaeon]NIV66488.1 cytochrome C biogenesis protein [Nitrosopumilaceae archaeon]NIX62367.1 cytochrome C biogenesis protein [Nitrosopumilaceae archaeon]